MIVTVLHLLQTQLLGTCCKKGLKKKKWTFAKACQRALNLQEEILLQKKKIEFSNSLQSYSPSTDGMVTGSRVRRVGARDKGGEGRVLCQEGGVRCCYGVGIGGRRGSWELKELAAGG